MYVAPVDRTVGDDEWRPFVVAQGFGHLAASGRDRPTPVIVPTQFVLDGDEMLLHLVAVNPIFGAIAEQPRVVMSVAGDWAFIPSSWKAIGDEDPGLGIPTTYYGAVQLTGEATVLAQPAEVASILRLQLDTLQPDVPVADPERAHFARLAQIRGIRIAVDEVQGKFKYGGNVDAAHRLAVVARLRDRGGPGDLAAAEHAEQRLEGEHAQRRLEGEPGA